ncbi:MAG: glycosyltransferase family 2 protein, partial [Oscillospiraceae bacterium]|nr:glycosyltransferase family 2 protein [Oscillospiraceae bacterium]
MIKLSLAVPCFNEQDNVKVFYEAVKKVFDSKDYEYEIVFVNDGSRDSTGQRLHEIYVQHERSVTVVEFSRNFGKEAAVLSAIRHCRGELITVIDADMQQRPEVVAEMVDYLDKHPNCDCVAAYQSERQESKTMKFCKSAFYALINGLSETQMHHDASDFRTFRRRMADTLTDLKEYRRFSKGLFSWVGFNTHFMPYTVKERHSGVSKWNFRKLFSYAVNGIVSFTTRPLLIPLNCGIFLSVGSFIALIISLLAVGDTSNKQFAVTLSVIVL